MSTSEKKNIIFGGGFYGQRALEQYGSENVDFFIDNDSKKIGTFCNGKEIITAERAAELYKGGDYQIIIASLYAESMAAQLDELGVSEYVFYISPVHGMYETDELIVNPYEQNKEAETMKDLQGDIGLILQKWQISLNHFRKSGKNQRNFFAKVVG